MSADHTNDGSVPLERFLQGLANILGPAGGPGLSDDEQTALLDFATLAAHSSVRMAGPLSTYMAGLACAELPAWERAEALRSLVDQMEATNSAFVLNG